MADPKTEAGRISELIALHRKDADTFDKMGKPRKAHDDLRHATTLERFALPLALEVDRLRAAIRDVRAVHAHGIEDGSAYFMCIFCDGESPGKRGAYGWHPVSGFDVGEFPHEDDCVYVLAYKADSDD